MSWEEQWREAVSGVTDKCTYLEGANILRKIMQTGLLKMTDIRDNPDKFFLAHRILAEKTPDFGPGFWIRFTVNCNLFAGTVVAIGSESQVSQLWEYQKQGLLGCFALTEKFAGVNSGMFVDTTATWNPSRQQFCLNSPNVGSHKNWISQGLVADKAVVIADLRIGGKSYGPHGFLIDFRRNGQLCNGIYLEDMGIKTTGNDLDNAWIKFTNVWLPQSTLLNKYADVVDNKYVQKVPGVRAMQMIGQRLFTGRVAVAQAALTFTKKLFASTKSYSDSKLTWSPVGKPPLSNIPQLRTLYEECEVTLTRLSTFVRKVELKLNACLMADTRPDMDLMNEIAVCKISAVESSIDLCFRLKQEVGSYALFSKSGLGQLDFLQCCKFAEGDSRILLQKLARDRFRHFTKGRSGVASEDLLCKKIAAAMKSKGSLSKQEVWDNEFTTVYELAWTVANRIMNKVVPALNSPKL